MNNEIENLKTKVQNLENSRFYFEQKIHDFEQKVKTSNQLLLDLLIDNKVEIARSVLQYLV